MAYPPSVAGCAGSPLGVMISSMASWFGVAQATTGRPGRDLSPGDPYRAPAELAAPRASHSASISPPHAARRVGRLFAFPAELSADRRAWLDLISVVGGRWMLLRSRLAWIGMRIDAKRRPHEPR